MKTVIFATKEQKKKENKKEEIYKIAVIYIYVIFIFVQKNIMPCLSIHYSLFQFTIFSFCSLISVYNLHMVWCFNSLFFFFIFGILIFLLFLIWMLLSIFAVVQLLILTFFCCCRMQNASLLAKLYNKNENKIESKKKNNKTKKGILLFIHGHFQKEIRLFSAFSMQMSKDNNISNKLPS